MLWSKMDWTDRVESVVLALSYVTIFIWGFVLIARHSPWLWVDFAVLYFSARTFWRRLDDYEARYRG